MSIRRPPSLEPTAAPQGRLDAVLRVGVHTRPSTSSRSSLAYDTYDVDETDGFFDGTKMRLQATRFVDAGVMFTQTEDSQMRMKAWREAEMLSSWKSLLEMAKKRKQIYAITDTMMSLEYAAKVFKMHYEFQSRRQYQTASSILNSLAGGDAMMLKAKDDAKHAKGQELMKEYGVGMMGSY